MLINICIVIAFIHLKAWILSAQVCSSTDDPHMVTFDGTPYEFHHEGSHFILYDDFKETRVTASYHACSYGIPNAKCNCGIYVKKGDALAFLDFCNINDPSIPLNKFYSITKTGQINSSHKAIKSINCRPMLPADENNEAAWNLIFTSSKYFKCAMIDDGSYVTYVLRTHDTRTPYDSIKVKIYVRALKLSRVEISPSENSYENTGGLCGMWDNDKTKELYFLNDQGIEQYSTDTNLLKEFWKLTSKWGSTVHKRCPECFIQSEKRIYCPCDDFSLSEINSNSYSNEPFCKVQMPNCVERSLNLPESVIAPPTVITPIKPPDYFIESEAIKLCTDKILGESSINGLLNQNLIDESLINSAIQNCIKDLMLTGNVNWTNIHSTLVTQIAVEIVTSGGSIQITETTTAILTLFCPSNCGGHGHCVLSTECKDVVSTEEDLDKLQNCLSPIKCECDENYGGVDCSIDLTDVPNFNFPEICYDLRENASIFVNAYGHEFAKRSTLYFKVLFTETDNNLQFHGSYSGIARVHSENHVSFELPVNEVWRHNKSYVSAKVAFSYQSHIFKDYVEFTLYDSKCKSCNLNVLDHNDDDEVCLIENACYDNGEIDPHNEDNMCDSTLDKDNWTYIGYVTPICNDTNEWSAWYTNDDPSGDGDIEILPLQDKTCIRSTIEVLTIDDIPLMKTKQMHFMDPNYGFICLNKDQTDNKCLDYKIRQCCRK